jgi:hypothetical protein
MWYVLGVLAALGIGMLGMRPYQSDTVAQMQNMHAAATASDWAMIDNAATAYIKAYYSTVEANSTATSPAVITVPMLQATNNLSGSLSSLNPYGQQWAVYVYQPTAGQLQAMVMSSGGTPIPEGEAPVIATMLGQEGGIVPYPGQDGTLNSTTAVGTAGGWSVPLTSVNPGPGHLVSLLAFNNGNLQTAYLNRFAVPGQPQLTTMSAPLNMGGNNITDADNVQAVSAQLGAGDVNGMPGALVIGSNFFCGDGTNAAVRTPGALYIQNQNGSASAPLNSGPITSSSQIAPGAVATQGGGCSPNGAMAASTNGTGQILACQSGSWQPLGGTGIVDVNTTNTMACTAGTTGILDLDEPYSGVFGGLVYSLSLYGTYSYGMDYDPMDGGTPLGIPVNYMSANLYYNFGGMGGPGSTLSGLTSPMVLLSCQGGSWGVEENGVYNPYNPGESQG